MAMDLKIVLNGKLYSDFDVSSEDFAADVASAVSKENGAYVDEIIVDNQHITAYLLSNCM